MSIARQIRAAARLAADARAAIPAAGYSLERAATYAKEASVLLDQAARLVRRIAPTENERIRVTRSR